MVQPGVLGPETVTSPDTPSILARLRLLAASLGCPLKAEHDPFECVWTARLGDFHGCGLDETDAYVSLYKAVAARLTETGASLRPVPRPHS
jgi:hypothetical protein